MGLTDFSNPELMTNYIRMTREEDFPIRLLVAYGPPFVKKTLPGSAGFRPGRHASRA